MLKDFTLSLELEPTENRVVQTAAIFWSHDVNTAKIYIELLRKGTPIILNKNVTVRVMMLFDDENKSEHIYTAKIEDELKGLVSITLEESMRMYVGQVTCGVYVDYQNEEKTDNGYFTFAMKRSLIDKRMPEMKQYYVSDFEDLKNIIGVQSEKINKNVDDMTVKVEEINKIIKDNDIVTKNEYNYATANGFLRKNRTGMIAHRGYNPHGPENTLKSIEAAGKTGFELVELDVRKTVDNEYILMHDDTVDRTTNGNGTVEMLGSNYIKGLVVDLDFVGKDENETIRVPTFEDACKMCARYGLGINVDGSKLEMNDVNGSFIVKMLKKYGLFENSFFVISNFATRNRFIENNPDASVTWLSYNATHNVQENIDFCNKYKNSFVTYSCKEMNDELLKTYKDNNIPVFLHSANSVVDVINWNRNGIRFIETDFILPQTGGVQR